MSFAKKALPKSHLLPDTSVPYKDHVGGVMVGYSGHVPGARDVDATAPLGGVPQFINQRPALQSRAPTDPLGQGLAGRPGRDQAWFGARAFDGDLRPWREEANGVMVTYAGHVPRARETMGLMTKGGVPPFSQPNQPLGQTTHFRDAIDRKQARIPEKTAGARKEISRKAVEKKASKSQGWIAKYDPYVTTMQAATNTWGTAIDPKPKSPDGQGYKVGYRGHVPNVRTTVGSSYWSEN